MNRIAILALALGAFWAAPSCAEEKSSNSGYTAEVRNDFLFSSDMGARGLVEEYDGRQYDGYEGAFDFSVFGPFAGKGPYTDFEAGVYGINSAEEEANMLLIVGDFFRLSGDFDTITHRQRFVRTGVTLNNSLWVANYAMNGEDKRTPTSATIRNDKWFNRGGTGYPRQRETYFARRFYDLGAVIRAVPYVEAVYVDFYRNTDHGNTYSRASLNGTSASEVPVDRQVNQESIGASVEFGEDAGLYYQYSYRDYQDYLYGPYAVPATATIDYPFEPSTPHTIWKIQQLKGRWNPAPDLSFSGALAYNSRTNLNDGFRARTMTGSLNALYTGIRRLTLYARLWGRNMNVRENKNFWDSNGNAGTADRRVSGDQIDRGAVRAELGGRYKVVDPVEVKASYRIDYVRRTNAPTQEFTNEATYSDINNGLQGLFIPVGTHANGVAEKDTQHRMNASVEVELPFEATLEAGYKKMIANRPSFESMPTWRDEAGAELYVPCPMGFYIDGAFDYAGERNDVSTLARTARFGREWRAGAGYSGQHGSLAFDYAYNKYKTHAEGWFGQTNKSAGGAAVVVQPLHDPTMNFREENQTLSADGRLHLPMGFTLKGNGAYTWSVSGISTFLLKDWMLNLGAQPYTGAGTLIAGDLTDLQPREVRISRIGFGVEFNPPKAKAFTVGAAYRTDRYADRTDDLNSGKVEVYDFAVNYAF